LSAIVSTELIQNITDISFNHTDSDVKLLGNFGITIANDNFVIGMNYIALTIPLKGQQNQQHISC